MKKYDYDFAIIGGGSAGLRSAWMLKEAGFSVVLFEQGRIGGTCNTKGCVPKKLLWYAARYFDSARYQEGYGIKGKLSLNYTTLQKNVIKETERLESGFLNYQQSLGVTIIRERVEFLDPHTLYYPHHKVTFGRAIVATGSRPKHIGDWPKNNSVILTNENIFTQKSLPKTITILGSGYVGIEFASILSDLGVKVEVIVSRNEILSVVDPLVASYARENLESKGVKFHLNYEVLDLELLSTKKRERGLVHLRHRVTQELKEHYADSILLALGREANVPNGLTKLGVKLTKRGFIKVNKSMQTSVDHIYALGDVVNESEQLVTVALQQATRLANHFISNKPFEPYKGFVPSAIFTQPEIAFVGLTRAEAIRQKIPVEIYKADFWPMETAMSKKKTDVLMMMVVHAKTKVILGVTMLGKGSADMIQIMTFVVNQKVKKPAFEAMNFPIHPTVAEEWLFMDSPDEVIG